MPIPISIPFGWLFCDLWSSTHRTEWTHFSSLELRLNLLRRREKETIISLCISWILARTVSFYDYRFILNKRFPIADSPRRPRRLRWRRWWLIKWWRRRWRWNDYMIMREWRCIDCPIDWLVRSILFLHPSCDCCCCCASSSPCSSLLLFLRSWNTWKFPLLQLKCQTSTRLCVSVRACPKYVSHIHYRIGHEVHRN